MKIWLDLRFIGENIYSTFILELLKDLIEKDEENVYLIYLNKPIDWFFFPNVIFRNIWIKNGSLKEQTKYLRILNSDKNNLMIFFNHFKPILYVWNYFILLSSLKDIYYSNFSNYFDKYFFLYLLEKNLKKSKKIICFDKNTIDELIEKFNIEEKKINIIQWFFPNINNDEIVEDFKINIKTKYGIKNDFFIYSGWEWVEKNYEKLMYVFKRLKTDGHNIDLIFLWENISRNIPLRNIVIKLELQNNIHFIWILKQNEKTLFYKEAFWVLFPSLYEPFPFRLSEAINFNSPIISSDLKNIKNIFWDSIKYFSAISVNNMYEKIKNYINTKDIKKFDFKQNYEKIKIKYSKQNTVNELLEIIK